MNLQAPATHGTHQMRFQSLHHEGRALSFPCDAQGRVHLDSLSARALQNYLFARTVIGRDYAVPAILPRELH